MPTLSHVQRNATSLPPRWKILSMWLETGSLTCSGSDLRHSWNSEAAMAEARRTKLWLLLLSAPTTACSARCGGQCLRKISSVALTRAVRRNFRGKVNHTRRGSRGARSASGSVQTGSETSLSLGGSGSTRGRDLRESDPRSRLGQRTSAEVASERSAGCR